MAMDILSTHKVSERDRDRVIASETGLEKREREEGTREEEQISLGC